MKKLMFCIFKKKETRKVAKLLGFDLKKTKCCICKRKIGEKTIGNFIHYKHKKAVLCTNATCFARWIIEEKPEIYGIKSEEKKNETKRNPK